MKRYRIPAICFALCFPTLLTWVYFSLLQSSPAWVQQVAYGSLKTLQFAFPVLWWLWDRDCFAPAKEGALAKENGAAKENGSAEKNGRSSAGSAESTDDVNQTKSLFGSALGLAIGFGVSVGVLIFLFYFGVLQALPEGEILRGKAGEKVAGLQLGSVWLYVGLGVFYSLIHSLLEEYYWRWYVFQKLRARLNFNVAAVLSSLGFMAHHVILLTYFFGWDSWVAYVCSLGVAIGGFVWSWLYEKSKSLVAVWISHLLVDAAIFAVGYFVIQHLF